MIKQPNQIELINTDSKGVQFSIRFETQGQRPPSPNSFEQQMRDLVPFARECLTEIFYLCDVCHKKFTTPNDLTSHQCGKCHHYFDTCGQCQAPTDGCYICQTPNQPFQQQVQTFLRNVDQKLNESPQ